MIDGFDLCDAFLEQVRRQPSAPALVWHGQDISYDELLALAKAVHLADDEPLCIVARKTPETIAQILACLLAGRRFLLPSPALDLDELRALPWQRLGGEADVSFIFTTSGSTGQPKIVPLGRGAVNRFVAWAGVTFDLSSGQSVINYAPLNFDLSLLDIWATLAHGGRVVLVDTEQVVSGRHLLDLLDRYQVNLIQAVPTFFALLLDTAPPTAGLDAVKHVVTTGDVLPQRTLGALPRLFPNARVHNLYGCTETNDSFIHEVTESDTAPLPLGTPLPGVRTLIVDDELYVSTPFQASGYLDEARTAEKFVDLPLPDGTPVRYFRTGDLVRRAADGRIFLVGRNDFQVKVRGVAVNTATVEQALLGHAEVREAAVVALPDEVAGHRLVAAVRRDPGSTLNSLRLREDCARLLPTAAIPTVLGVTDDPLPRTSTGKIDRNAVTARHLSRTRER
ncbi:AMP-binding protein [Nonomuraea sp. 10N515B]|uniref:AMP-binding protein n=1 Tax=Nonomuraea sp. 10N515B TaxID=3457422 RepID=UPI003FCD1B6D